MVLLSNQTVITVEKSLSLNNLFLTQLCGLPLFQVGFIRLEVHKNKIFSGHLFITVLICYWAEIYGSNQWNLVTSMFIALIKEVVVLFSIHLSSSKFPACLYTMILFQVVLHLSHTLSKIESCLGTGASTVHKI